ncbi:MULTISPECIES: phage baseplate assembly protein V [Clostridium]|uniref:phage baseplate assembly protein V n=1 Tax=Clostridium TaxID=1485 RepID=UPI0022E75567|nr:MULTISPECIES: phage baseplate assembly protein V [Clostridium]MBS4843162.1 phage tail protein [Clostridium sp.]MDU1404248.1 phage baseplate assembly protein V [Clostridium sp.]MDU1605498.1 phage baseplate assembly protein V [Clostridium sp.]MDU2895967.1 phage baseplate assembly protein V [Clostridium sp.]MDU3008359.1 phage baseplate assembly protein V [Clostridium sp.]
MSEQYVYEYKDINVSGYDFEKIIELKILREINEHAKLKIRGIISEENEDKYVEEANDKSFINISVNDNENNIKNLFQGIVTDISIDTQNNVRILEIEALSRTYLMDIKKMVRTFQDENYTYMDVINILNNENGNVLAMDNITDDKKIDKLIVQYKETDWELIKRLASHFNAGLIPECQLDGTKYIIGMRKDGISYSLDEFNYSIKKSIHEYKEKYENGIETLNDMNLISYEITTNKMLNLCEAVNFNGKNLYVYKAIIEICDSEFINKYVLRDEKGMKIQKRYNDKLIGLSLKGNILDTKNDVVKIKLDIDSSQNKDTAKWFPYSTVYSSEDGTGWYCMPEVGDAIRLYFPDNEEKNAYAISSVNLKSSNSQKRSDPSVKNIGTKYGKQLVMKPGAVEIIGGNNLLMRMTDDGGIEIKSDKKIILDAQDDIEIKGKAKVSIKGDEGVDLTQNSANLAIKDDVKMTGGKVKIE